MPDKRVGRASCAVALAVLQAACAVTGSSGVTGSADSASGDRDCYAGLTLVCDADRPGARRYSGCRCVSQGHIDDFLHRR